MRLALLLVTACSSAAAPAVPRDARLAVHDAPRDAGTQALRWIPGDLHMHVAPIDAVEGQTLDIAHMGAVAHAAGLEFVIATPHTHPWTWADPAQRRSWLAKWSAIAVAARATTGTTIIPGVEYTDSSYGHFGVSGVDLNTIGDHFLADATKAGAFVVVNHPFAVPTNIPGIAASDRDLSFRPWSDHRGVVPHLDGVEVWNVPLGLANMISRPNGQTGEQRAFLAADALARAEHRRIAVVGGSDSHHPTMEPTTWVLAPDASAHAILAALHGAATCVGGPEAGTLEAHGDADPARRSFRGNHAAGDRFQRDFRSGNFRQPA